MNQKIKIKLQEYTNHPFMAITNCCNASIFYALFVAKLRCPNKKVAIPDQGGWLKYRPYAELLGFEVIEYPTNECSINLPYLASIAHDCSAIIITNPGGYIARQPIKELYDACHETLLIEDVSGSLGNYTDSSHIKIGSFGKWKPLSVGYGGFISFYRKEDYLLAREIITTSKVGPEFFELLLIQLEGAKARYHDIFARTRQIKKDLNKFPILRKDEDGLVVIVQYKDKKEKEAIEEYCVNHALEYTSCPRAIRTLHTAISIEVKRQ